MLISTTKKFIFFHNYKVAGTSIRKALKLYESKPFYIFSRLIQKMGLQNKGVFKIFNSHVSASTAKEFLPKSVYDNYFKFGFVRNPWSWQVSLYTYMLKNNKHYQHEIIKSLGSFKEYLLWRIQNELRLQKDFFYDSDNNAIVDFIGKHENINDDFKIICEKFDVYGIELPVLNKSSKFEWSKYYDLESFEMVKSAYREDIDCFDYTDDASYYGITDNAQV